MIIKDRLYEIDDFGVVTQMDHRPFKYDQDYAAIYDSKKYTISNDLLQALRFGFVIGAHGRMPGSLMDVGYGNGAFLKFASKKIPYTMGHDVTGVALNGSYKMPEMVKADVYTFWDVLEHFPSCNFLHDLQCDTICISLPFCHFHTQGLKWMETWHHLKPDEHIRHFNPSSLKFFMASYGWRDVARSWHEDIVRVGKDNPNILSMAFKRSQSFF